jgi:hypothetical protein
MHRFVVQQHYRDSDDWHFDLMLECGEALVTFTSGVPPDDDSRLPTLVRQLGNHRLAYLEYQGEVSGGRGWCTIYDQGQFEWLVPGPETCPVARLGETAHPTEDTIVVRLAGEKMKGTYRLTRETKSGADYWRLRKERDGATKHVPLKMGG